MTALLAMEGVRKRFGDFFALDGVTATVSGRAVGLLGPNGAGKTTLMKCCLGLLRPDAGELSVLGMSAIREPTAVRLRLGYAAEGPGRIPGLSGLESVAYAAELCGLRRRDALLRAHDMLDLVGLDESRYRPVETYSTGMHQRIKVAMALVHDPELVLLDEPTSGLDPQSRDELLELIVALRDGDGPAILLSTHLLHDVERTCDAVVIMQKGRVRFAGALDDLQTRMPGQYVVRLAEPSPALTEALTIQGARVEVRDRPDLLHVALPEPGDPALLWATAARCEASIVHLAQRAATLEEAFMQAVKSEEAA
ncbi:MAG: ABC transporter ATP-binding protein [Myxococcales bacterium]|nr:ABC transporter ATP-binding protein [Myxococcales bacterium]